MNQRVVHSSEEVVMNVPSDLAWRGRSLGLHPSVMRRAPVRRIYRCSETHCEARGKWVVVSGPSGATRAGQTRPAPVDSAALLSTLVAAVLSSAIRGVNAVRTGFERASGRSIEPADGAVPPLVDAVIDLTLRGVAVTARSADTLIGLARPVVGLALAPPIVPRRFWPQTRLDAMTERGRSARMQADRIAKQVVGDLIPEVVSAVLDRIDLTQLVLDRVKLATIIAEIDLNEVAAKLDIVPIVDRAPIERILDRIDIDTIVAGLDLNAIVARIDVNAIAAKLDLDAVIARLDLAGIVNRVIDEIDLPDLIRESSGAMASETVLGVRMQGIEADERVNRIVDRILLRRRARGTAMPDSPGGGDGTGS